MGLDCGSTEGVGGEGKGGKGNGRGEGVEGKEVARKGGREVDSMGKIKTI